MGGKAVASSKNMDQQIIVANAGNVQAPALAVLKSMGYVVGKLPTDQALLQATRPGVQLIAEDPLLLLGLASIAQARGENWRPSDSEIEALLEMDEAPSND